VPDPNSFQVIDLVIVIVIVIVIAVS